MVASPNVGCFLRLRGVKLLRIPGLKSTYRLTRKLRLYRTTRISDYLYQAFLTRREPGLDSATAAHTHLLRFFRLSPLLLGFGSDFEKSFKSRSRIFKQASRRVSDFTIHHPSMTAHDRPWQRGRTEPTSPTLFEQFHGFFYVPFQLIYCVRMKETRLNVTAQWRDHLNRERGFSHSQHDLTRFLNETLVVYHLHGKTSRFTVWLNGKQFRPEIAFTISTNQFHLPKKRPRKPETGIKDGFEEMEDEYSLRKNWTTFSNVPLR